jgi:tripartite ATP-independent transporter DctP family solute receptor
MVNKLLLLLFTILLLTSCKEYALTETEIDEDGPDYIIRFAHEESTDSVQHDYVEAFKKTLENKTNHTVQVEIYPVGQLGDATEQAEQLQIGAIDMAIISPGNTGTMVPENQLFILHFLFSDDMEVNHHVLNNSKALDTLTEVYNEHGMLILDYWTQGFQQWTANVNISQPEDLRGARIRTIPSPLLLASYEAYGASPTPMAYEEVYSGLQLNMIDGQENPFFAIEEMNFFEVQDYLIDSRHAIYATTTAINPDFYDELPEDIQKAVEETVAQLSEESLNIQEERNETALESIKSQSHIAFTALDDEERAAFREASEPVFEIYKEEVGETGAEILEELQEEIADAENDH